MINRLIVIGLALCISVTFLPACAPQSGDGTDTSEAASENNGLSDEEMAKGIGPIKDIQLTAIDDALATRGEEVFNVKCVACHRFEERYVGPPLGDILEKRTPEFIMNMMLNPEEMIQKHPEVKAMLAQFLTPMPNQNLTEADARAALEYIRRETDKASS